MTAYDGTSAPPAKAGQAPPRWRPPHPRLPGPGMNVRTARVRIAELAAGFGSRSRAPLGYPVARSGILDQVQQHRQAQAQERARD